MLDAGISGNDRISSKQRRMEDTMAVRVGINGFGRIGMLTAKAAMQSGVDVEIVAVNDLAPME